jgi:hypothetical protein
MEDAEGCLEEGWRAERMVAGWLAEGCMEEARPVGVLLEAETRAAGSKAAVVLAEHVVEVMWAEETRVAGWKAAVVLAENVVEVTWAGEIVVEVMPEAEAGIVGIRRGR